MAIMHPGLDLRVSILEVAKGASRPDQVTKSAIDRDRRKRPSSSAQSIAVSSTIRRRVGSVYGALSCGLVKSISTRDASDALCVRWNVLLEIG